MTTTDAAVFKGAAAIITLPVGVLQAPHGTPGAVEFLPDVPSMRRAIARLRMGAVMKVQLRFAEPFWESAVDRNAAFLHAAGLAFPVWWTTLPVRSGVITGWAGGPDGEALSHRSADAVLDDALDALAAITGVSRSHSDPMLKAWVVNDWQADPFSRGAYSYGAVGSAGAADELADPVEDTLFFAGEAAHVGMNGTVSGAIASGRRAAERLLNSDI